MTEPISYATLPDDVGHAGYAICESADELHSTAASSQAHSECRVAHNVVVAVAMGAVTDRSHHNELGRSSETFLATPDHGAVRCSLGGVHGCQSGRESPGAIFRTRKADSGTSECSDEADAALSSHVSQPARASSHCSSDKSLPTQQSNVDRTSSNPSMTNAHCQGPLSKDSRNGLNPGKGTRAPSRTHESSSRDKLSALEVRDPAITRNRNNVLRNSVSESRCECPVRKNTSSPNLRLNLGSFPASHLCTETGRRRPKQVLSAEEFRKARGMLEKDSPGRKRKLSSQAMSPDLEETTMASLALEIRCHVAKDAVVSEPKGVLSVILDTDDTKKASASFDDADKTLLAESPPDKSCSEVKSERGAGISAVCESNVLSPPVGESDARNEANAKHEPVHVDFPKADAGVDSTCAVRNSQSTTKLILSTGSIPSTTQDGAAVAQFSTSPEQSESLALDFDAESRSASTQTVTAASRQVHDKTAKSSTDAPSSDSAQLSPQPELSFLLSDALSGSDDNTNVSWSAVNTLFRDNTAQSLWGGPSTAANDVTVVTAGSERAKGASVPDRPTSPETDDVRTPSPFGRAKRTVSCPLSFDAESMCFETGDREAFEPRQSSSNCWCCDKNERALEHKQSSAHMPVDEYLRLKERLDQRPHTPALWENSKSDQSDIEHDLDMATLDCSVAGFEQYSHVELFCHSSSSSVKSRAADSLEQWLNEDGAEGFDKYADECYGTSKTLSFAEDYIVLSIGGDDSEIAISDASNRESIKGEATRDTLNQEAGNADVATPGPLTTSADCGEPEAMNISTKWPSPKETRKETREPREMGTVADEGENAATAANGGLSLVPSVHQPDVLAVSYVNTRYSGIELAEALNEFATGLSLKDVVFIPRRQTRTGVTPMPRLDDVDFSKFVPDDALSVQESLAKIPKIICKGTLRK